MSKKVYLVLIVLLVAIDMITKWATVQFFEGHDGREVFIGDFAGIDFLFNYTKNRGAAWGLLQQVPIFLLTIRIIFIAGLGYYLFTSSSSFAFHLACASVLGGALGNVLDFFIYGHVVDMVHLVFWGYDYPVFNVADAAITCGIIAILFSMCSGRHSTHEH